MVEITVSLTAVAVGAILFILLRMEQKMASLDESFTRLRAALSRLATEIAALRSENADLKARLDAAPTPQALADVNAQLEAAAATVADLANEVETYSTAQA